MTKPRTALTFYYEAYYDAWLGGQYFRKTAELHKQYGMCSLLSVDVVDFCERCDRY
jgi:hypothetical protein